MRSGQGPTPGPPILPLLSNLMRHIERISSPTECRLEGIWRQNDVWKGFPNVTTREVRFATWKISCGAPVGKSEHWLKRTGWEGIKQKHNVFAEMRIRVWNLEMFWGVVGTRGEAASRWRWHLKPGPQPAERDVTRWKVWFRCEMSSAGGM